MKKLLLAVIALGLFTAFLFLRPQNSPPESALAPSAPAMSASSGSNAVLTKAPALKPPAAPSAPPADAKAPLDASSRAAVKECWGKEMATWDELGAGFQALGAKGKRELQWRVLRTEVGGREIRIRLSREPRENGDTGLEVKLFSVDEEGLPDAIKPEPGQRENPAGWLSNYLRGKSITQDTRLEEITLPDGRTLSLETEGREVMEAQVQGPGKALACSRKENDPRCRCL